MQLKVEPEVEPPSAAERERAEESLGQLEANLRHLVQGYDSEATESSSGGESCDEADRFPHSNTAYVAIKKRAKYTWLSNRADIASKWTWLTAQGGGDTIFRGFSPNLHLDDSEYSDFLKYEHCCAHLFSASGIRTTLVTCKNSLLVFLG